MKKTAIILIAILLCAALTACAPAGGETSDSTDADNAVTTAAPVTGEWDRDTAEHWQVGANGEKLNVAAHTPNEEGICPICNSMIDKYDDGESNVNTYDANGDLVRHTYYAADGSVNYETFSEYADGADGERYEVKTTEYDYTNGFIYTVEFNEYGDHTARTISDMEGKVEQLDRWEREYNSEGDPIWKKSYTNDVLVQEITGYKTVSQNDYTMRFPETVIDYYEDGTKLVTENGDNGDVAKETYYKADGTVEKELTYTYEYDSAGNLTNSKVYENDRLVKESEYGLDAEGWNYHAKDIEYHEDGSKTVYEYDTYGETVNESHYDADGNVTDQPRG